MSIRDNLLRVRERIDRAAVAAGRSADEVTLVGVTKYVDAAQAAALVAAGCRDLGESRPQELWDKAGEVASATGARSPLASDRPPATQQGPAYAPAGLADPFASIASGCSQRLTTRQKRPRQASSLEVKPRPSRQTWAGARRGRTAMLDRAPGFRTWPICGLMTIAAIEGALTSPRRELRSAPRLPRSLVSDAPPASVSTSCRWA